MVLFLTLLGGICWTIVYLELIRVGFKDKTYGMPFVALALNIAWEAIYAYISLRDNPSNIQSWIILVWFLLDLVVLYTYLRYGIKEFPKHINKKYFVPWTITIFIMSFAIQSSFVLEFGNLSGWYSAFLQNLIMSLLFINMLVIRMSTGGQSLIIAINKWIGTLAPTILFGIIYGNQLVLILGIFCSVFDVIYIYLLTIALITSFIHPKSSKVFKSNDTNKFQA